MSACSAAAAVVVTGQAPQSGAVVHARDRRPPAARSTLAAAPCATSTRCAVRSRRRRSSAPTFISTWGRSHHRGPADRRCGRCRRRRQDRLATRRTRRSSRFMLQWNGASPVANAASRCSARLGSLRLATAQPRRRPAAQRRRPRSARHGRDAADGARAPSHARPDRRDRAGQHRPTSSRSRDAMLRNPRRRLADGPRRLPGVELQPAGRRSQPANVGDLELAWVWGMNEGTQPAVAARARRRHLSDQPGNIVQALDGRSGDLLWEYRAGPEQGGPMRNLAIYNDKVYVATTDARLVALDARTGQLVWDVEIAPRGEGLLEQQRPARRRRQGDRRPRRLHAVRRRRLLHQRARCREPARAQWKFDTVAKPGQPGGDTWGKMPGTLRAGGETWITGSYDPDLNLTYWGVAQAKPWVPASRGMTAFDQALYTNSTLALRVDRRHAGLALPAHPGRSDGHGRGVRARARRRRRSQARASRPARPASCGSWIARPASSSATRKRSSRTSSTASIRRPARSAIGPTSPRRRLATGSRDARARRAGTTGRRCPTTRTRRCSSSRWCSRASRSPGRKVELKEGSGQHRRRSALVRDARDRRQARQARRLRREHDEGGLERRAARVVSHVGR